jgi:hypothetical protein
MRLDRAFVETRIVEWNDLFLLNQKFMANFIFRGQGDSRWGLKTSLERLIESHHSSPLRGDLLCHIYESEMLKEFQWKYPSYEKNLIPQNDEYLEWLSIMQHYGAPTRLLDFSYSMYVALFMAMDNVFSDEYSLWCINTNVLNSSIMEEFYVQKHTRVTTTDELEDFAYSLANSSISDKYIVDKNRWLLPVRPHLCNERISRQQGLFLVPSSITVSFDEILKSYYNNGMHLDIPMPELVKWSNLPSLSQTSISILKINIGKENKLRLTKALCQMNITSETMYPGLVGLAQSVRRLREGLGDYKD